MIEEMVVFFCIVFISLIGYIARSLSASGAIAASLVGISIYVGYEMKGLVVLGVFFGTSTVWSKYKKEKKGTLEDKVEKSDRRDWIQVLANGGIAASISLLSVFTDNPYLVYGFLISLAAANSDTWASEIGSLSKRSPLFILSFKRVDKGTSGAVSPLGTLAALGGALIIAYTGYLLFDLIDFYALLFITVFGFVGNVFDTLLGATVQVVYRCSVCMRETEKRSHCGVNTEQQKGYLLFNNDVVNVASVLAATIIGGGLVHILWI
ncbi:DUF92 domain-containing protein [Bacillus sp. CGMCC 1.16541]|uniref:DUF92 domain-containing protein n=1 Tax=Bacillus sp. CGMCC 1.16541 TaxID=2185143 RepID=UPI000D72CD09|nr:DUF92 domain-containing protein [Bacillus sp. CGMCC 1.16541]